MKPTAFAPLNDPGHHNNVPGLGLWLSPVPELHPPLETIGWYTYRDGEGRKRWKTEDWEGLEYVKALLRRFLEVNPHQLGQYHQIHKWVNTLLEPRWKVDDDSISISCVDRDYHMKYYFGLFIELAERGLWTGGCPSVISRRTPWVVSSRLTCFHVHYALVVPPPKDDTEAYRRAVLQAEVNDGGKLANGLDLFGWKKFLCSFGTNPEAHCNPRRMLYDFKPGEGYKAEKNFVRLRELLEYCWRRFPGSDVSGLDPAVIRQEFEAAYQADMLTLPGRSLGRWAMTMMLSLAALHQYIIDLDDLALMRRYSTVYCDRRPPAEGATVPDFDCSGFPPLARTSVAVTGSRRILTQEEVAEEAQNSPTFKLLDPPRAGLGTVTKNRRQRVVVNAESRGLKFELKEGSALTHID